MTLVASAPETPSSLLPIGQFVGTFPGGADGADQPHEIRRGTDIHEISDEDFVAWMAAHGTDGSAAGGPPSRAQLETELRGQGLEAPGGVIDGLLDRGLLARVPHQGPGAIEFARTHRAVPTLYGLGNSPEEPGLFGIGLLGHELLRVTRPVFELWAWADVDGDLWTACESFAAQEREAGVTDPELSDPALVLEHFLVALTGLLSAQAVYLDIRPDTDGESADTERRAAA
jgi:hypothetical protein